MRSPRLWACRHRASTISCLSAGALLQTRLFGLPGTLAAMRSSGLTCKRCTTCGLLSAQRRPKGLCEIYNRLSELLRKERPEAEGKRADHDSHPCREGHRINCELVSDLQALAISNCSIAARSSCNFVAATNSFS